MANLPLKLVDYGLIEGQRERLGLSSYQMPTEEERGARVHLSGENRLVHGTLLGPGLVRNLGLLRLGPFSASKLVCATVENTATVRMEGGSLYLGCTSPNIPGVVRTTGEGVVELVGAYVSPNGGAMLELDGSAGAVVRVSGTTTLDVPFSLKDTTLGLEGQEPALNLTRQGRFVGENRLEVGEGAALRFAAGTYSLEGTLRGEVRGSLVLAGATLQVPEGQELTLDLSGNGLQVVQGTLLGPGLVRNLGLLRLGPSSANKRVCATVENTATVRMEGGYLYLGCTSPNIPGVVRNRGEVRLGDAYVSRGGGDSAIYNQGAFVKDSGAGEADVDPTFYALPGGYEQALSGTFRFRDYRNFR